MQLYLQSHHFTHNTVGHFDSADKHQHIEDQLAHIRPHLRYRRSVGIDDGRAGCKQGEDDAGQYDDRTFQANGDITLDKALADILRRFARKGRERNRRNGRVEISLRALTTTPCS